MALLRNICARPWLLLIACCPIAACTGPTGPEYFAQRRDDSGPVVRVWEVRLSGALKYVASHLILEVRGADDSPGHGETWEVFQFEDISDPDHGHIHRFAPRDGGGTIGPRDRLVAEFRGPRADRAVTWIRENAPKYRYRHRYVACPGPNSNTFVATLIRDCPDLAVDLPPTTVGKDFAGWFRAGGTTTKAGVQIETPIVGAQAGFEEGIELHLLGSCLIGVDLVPPALKLAFVGRVGFPETARGGGSDADE